LPQTLVLLASQTGLQHRSPGTLKYKPYSKASLTSTPGVLYNEKSSTLLFKAETLSLSSLLEEANPYVINSLPL
jgi:hypothetical protein